MSRKMLWWSLTSFLIAALIAAAGLRGQSVSNDTENDTQVLQGSFLVTVSVNETGRVFKALESYTPGGIVIVTFFNPAGAPQIAQGAWLRTGDGEFATTIEGVSPDVTLPSGQRVSFVSAKIQDKLTLDESGDSFNGVFQDHFFDASGNVVRIGTGTIQGSRITVEPLD
jgi:hypothetical protein